MSNSADFLARVTDETGIAGVVRRLLTAGDERLHLAECTGRNRYGVPPRPDTEDVWFASSTASPITLRSYAAVASRIRSLLSGDRGTRIGAWADEIRARIAAVCGIGGCAVILAGSGTEAELLALSIARHVLRRPLVNIVVAPTETGSGVLAAAAGRHFLDSASLSPRVIAGDLLHGLEPHAVSTQTVAIRDDQGDALSTAQVDAAVSAACEQAIARGCDVLVHCLDTSKTGLSGLSRAGAAALSARWPGRCSVVVDACQFRCDAGQVRQDLADGFMVMVTGSKFVGGPPFAGALLVPPSLRERMGDLRLPAGLQAYSAARDWPDDVTFGAGSALTAEDNIGLYGRWEAALAELERFVRAPLDHRSTVVASFGALVRQGADAAGLRIVPLPPRSAPTIFSLVTTSEGRHPVAAEAFAAEALAAEVLAAEALHGALGKAGFRIGQPVSLGPAKALRVALAAPQISDAAERLASGASAVAAMAPIADELGRLFEAWSRLRWAAAPDHRQSA